MDGGRDSEWDFATTAGEGGHDGGTNVGGQIVKCRGHSANVRIATIHRDPNLGVCLQISGHSSDGQVHLALICAGATLTDPRCLRRLSLQLFPLLLQPLASRDCR